MTQTLNLAIGDLVVRNGKILKVSQVKKDTIDLRPFFHIKTSNGLTFTLLLAHTNDGHIRRLVSKNKIGKLLKLIIKKPTAGNNNPEFDAKTALSHNQLAKTLRAIKTLWQEKQKRSGILQGTKLTIFRQAMIQASEEIAATNKISIGKAESTILSALNFCQKKLNKI